jgi:uncharacterized protein (DUF433 family)
LIWPQKGAKSTKIKFQDSQIQCATRITINPEVMVGKPAIRGMRITVDQILLAMAGGVTVNELLQDYPKLEQEDIQAVFTYAGISKN